MLFASAIYIFIACAALDVVCSANEDDAPDGLALFQRRATLVQRVVHPFSLGPIPRFDHSIGVQQHGFPQWLEKVDQHDDDCSLDNFERISQRCRNYKRSPIEHKGAAPRTALGEFMTRSMMPTFVDHHKVPIYYPNRLVDSRGAKNRSETLDEIKLGLKLPVSRGVVRLGSWPLSFIWEISESTLRGRVSCHCMLNSSAQEFLPAQWLAIGFSLHGGMPGADIVVARKATDGSLWLEDRYATHFARPELDAHQDYKLVQEGSDAPHSDDPSFFSFTFDRKLKTGDVKDWLVNAEDVHLIFSAGLDDFHHHRKAQEYPHPINLYQGGVYDSSQDQGQHRFPRSYEELAAEIEDSAVAEAADERCTSFCFSAAGELNGRRPNYDFMGDEALISIGQCLKRCGTSVGRIAALRIFRRVALRNASVDAHELQERALSTYPLAKLLLHVPSNECGRG